MFDFATRFNAGLSYDDFLNKYGTDGHRTRWADLHARVSLSEPQRKLLAGFQRELKVLCMAGTWCGDCVNQCPIFDHFDRASPKLVVRFVDRDADSALAAELSICGAPRVPAVVFLSEDNFEVGRYGDRTLAKYRQMMRDQLGPACPTGLVPPPAELLAAVTQEWLDECERVQWMLRTSSRLRQKHGD